MDKDNEQNSLQLSVSCEAYRPRISDARHGGWVHLAKAKAKDVTYDA